MRIPTATNILSGLAVPTHSNCLQTHSKDTPFQFIATNLLSTSKSYLLIKYLVMQTVTPTSCLPRAYNLMLVRLKMLLQPSRGKKALFTVGQPVSCPFPLFVTDSALWVSSSALYHLLAAQHRGRISMIKDQTRRVNVSPQDESLSVLCIHRETA